MSFANDTTPYDHSASLLDLLLVTFRMVLSFFGPEHEAFNSSKSDLEYWLVWLQYIFAVCDDGMSLTPRSQDNLKPPWTWVTLGFYFSRVNF